MDDTALRVEGAKPRVMRAIYGAAAALKDALDAANLTVSPKTVLLASEPAFGRELHCGL